jgi:hypothetical protein
MINRSLVGIAVLALLLMSAAADAAVITFTDRATWTAAAGGVSGGEDFNGFVVDTEFRTAPVALADGMSIGVMVNDGNDNLIDVVPISSEVDVNGTPVAHMWNGFNGAATLPFVSFSTPVYAFGADFQNFNDDFLRTRIELYNGAVLVDTLSPAPAADDVVRFFGFVSDTAITQIRFTQVQADVFGMDNIEIQTQSVPEPASLLLFSAALGAGAIRLRRKS